MDQIKLVEMQMHFKSQKESSLTFVYVMQHKVGLSTVDSTQCYRNPAFITATGGTITCCGDFKIHTFTGPGTFTVYLVR